MFLALIFSLFFTFGHSETMPPFGRAVIYQNEQESFARPGLDGAKNVYIEAKQGKFQISIKEGKVQPTTPVEAKYHVFSKEGKLQRTIPSLNSPYHVLKNGELIYRSSGLRLLKFLDHEGKDKFEVEFPDVVFHGMELKNGDLAVNTLRGKNVGCLSAEKNNCIKGETSDTEGVIYRTDSKGIIKASAVVGNYVGNMIEHPDGTITTNDFFRIFFLTPDLKLKGVFAHADRLAFQTHFATENGILVAQHKNKVWFIDNEGKLKHTFQLKDPEEKIVGAALLPGNLVCVNASDGYTYVLDTNGEIKATHHHDSQKVSEPYYVGKNTVAYFNSTEIVFIDALGKERGTHPFPREALGPKIMPIEDGRFLAFNFSGKQLYFFEF